MSLDNEQALLEAIEKKIKSGTLPEHFFEVLDRLLGTKMVDRDQDVEEAWEESNRKK
jgi:hypothetical protein